MNKRRIVETRGIFMVRICLILLLFSFGNHFALAEVNTISVSDAYVRGLPPGVANTSAYMTIHNNSDEALVLSGASSPVAESVTIHSTEMKEGLMTMEHMMSLTINAHESQTLESGGIHLMLMGLMHPLSEGEEVHIRLEFANGTGHLITLPVISVLNE